MKRHGSVCRNGLGQAVPCVQLTTEGQKDNSDNRGIVREAMAGTESRGDMKQEHLPKQDEVQ